MSISFGSNEKMAWAHHWCDGYQNINCVSFLFLLLSQISIVWKGREIDELTTELMASSMVTTLAESSSVAMATSTVDSHQQSERSSAPITPTRFERIFIFEWWIQLNPIDAQVENQIMAQFKWWDSVNLNLRNFLQYFSIHPNDDSLELSLQVNNWYSGLVGGALRDFWDADDCLNE